jgi:hypothetical protein
MLIFAGCPAFCAGPILHSFYSPQPWSDSLGDACLSFGLNANETSWIGYRDLPPQIRFFFKYVWSFFPGALATSLFNCSPRTAFQKIRTVAAPGSKVVCATVPK